MTEERKRAADILRHADTIAVRVQLEGRWHARFLTELPPAIAIREAFNLLFGDEPVDAFIPRGAKERKAAAYLEAERFNQACATAPPPQSPNFDTPESVAEKAKAARSVFDALYGKGV